MKRVVKIEWNKAGEAVGTRQIVLEVPVPVVGRVTDTLENAILQLPMRPGGYDEKREEMAGQDFGDAGSPEVVWYVSAGERFSAPEPSAVLFLLRAEPARRAAEAQAKREAREREEKERLDRQVAALEEELAVPPEKRQGVSTYPEALFIPPGIPAELTQRATEYRMELRKIAGENKERERISQEQNRAKKAAREELLNAARGTYIREWAAEHGSERLRLQLEAGLDGWPLYLHERLISDLGENAQLDNDGEDQDLLTNPMLKQLQTAKDLASNLLGLGQILPEQAGDAVLRHVQILPIKFDEDDEGNGGFTNVYARAIWTPGPPELFHKYTVRVRCPDEDD